MKSSHTSSWIRAIRTSSSASPAWFSAALFSAVSAVSRARDDDNDDDEETSPARSDGPANREWCVGRKAIDPSAGDGGAVASARHIHAARRALMSQHRRGVRGCVTAPRPRLALDVTAPPRHALMSPPPPTLAPRHALH